MVFEFLFASLPRPPSLLRCPHFGPSPREQGEEGGGRRGKEGEQGIGEEWRREWRKREDGDNDNGYSDCDDDDDDDCTSTSWNYFAVLCH
eukprot:1126593-Karenia_brevis.AAC.1